MKIQSISTFRDALDQEGALDYSYPEVAYYDRSGRWPTLEETKEFDRTLDLKTADDGGLRG